MSTRLSTEELDAFEREWRPPRTQTDHSRQVLRLVAELREARRARRDLTDAYAERNAELGPEGALAWRFGPLDNAVVAALAVLGGDE